MSDILDKNEIKENLDSLDGWIIKNNYIIFADFAANFICFKP